MKAWHKKKLKEAGVSNAKIVKSPRKDSQKRAIFEYKGKKHQVDFGDPDMREYPGTDRGNNYCSRSYGLAKYHNVLNDPLSANFWSRIILWKCEGKKSLKL